jgi:hypothetical protein
MKMPLCTVALLLATAAMPLAAQTDAERELALREAQQRERISQARAQHSAQFRAREMACYQRFAVNDCLNESRRAEREIMADLRRQEILINDAQRKRRAAGQLLRADERLHGPGRP